MHPHHVNRWSTKGFCQGRKLGKICQVSSGQYGSQRDINAHSRNGLNASRDVLEGLFSTNGIIHLRRRAIETNLKLQSCSIERFKLLQHRATKQGRIREHDEFGIKRCGDVLNELEDVLAKKGLTPR